MASARKLGALGAVGILASPAALAGAGLRAYLGHSTAAAARPQSVATIVLADLATEEVVSGTLGYGTRLPVQVPGDLAGKIVTSTRAPGDVVDRGEVLYAASGHAVRLMVGGTPAYRKITTGTSGPDVLELEQNLLALGCGTGSLVANGSFTAADAAAVRCWQHSTGDEVTGYVTPADVFFAAGPVRVASVPVALGGTLGGQPAIEYTGLEPLVSATVTPGVAQHLSAGSTATITLPSGGAAIPATVASVDRVATLPSTAPGTAASPSGATIGVTVRAADPSRLPSFDSAPVTLRLHTAVATHVLAVPVTALLALPGGAIGVEVVEGTGTRVVPVRTGVYSSSQVEISGDGLHEGQTVVVAST